MGICCKHQKKKTSPKDSLLANLAYYSVEQHLPITLTPHIATDKRGIHMIFLLFLEENICCGYSLEVSLRGTSNEHLQHVYVEK